jgi:hypothetical protein
MPGDALIRETFEGAGELVEEKVERELQQLPSGAIREIPLETLRVQSEGGRLRKTRDVYRSVSYTGCGHVKLTPEQEASLARDRGQRSGFCLRCDKEFCADCLNTTCKRCKQPHTRCDSCGRNCCPQCLLITPAPESGTPCVAACRDCQEATSRKKESASPSPPENPAIEGGVRNEQVAPSEGIQVPVPIKEALILHPDAFYRIPTDTPTSPPRKTRAKRPKQSNPSPSAPVNTETSTHNLNTLQAELDMLEEEYRPNSAIALAIFMFCTGGTFGFLAWLFHG